MASSSAKNVIAGLICMFSIVNLANTSNIQGTIYSAEDNVIKSIEPIASGYVDTNYLGSMFKETTEDILSIPIIDGICNTWNESGAANVIGNVFRPMIEGYQGFDFSEAAEQYGLRFDEESGQYIVVDTDLTAVQEPVDVNVDYIPDVEDVDALDMF